MYVSSVRISTLTRLYCHSPSVRLEFSASQHFRLWKLLFRSTPPFFLLRLWNLSRLILQPSSLPAALSRAYTHPSLEIPGPRQKAGAAHELKPLSIPLVTSGNLRDSVFVPGSLGLTHNIWSCYGYWKTSALSTQCSTSQCWNPQPQTRSPTKYSRHPHLSS